MKGIYKIMQKSVSSNEKLQKQSSSKRILKVKNAVIRKIFSKWVEINCIILIYKRNPILVDYSLRTNYNVIIG